MDGGQKDGETERPLPFLEEELQFGSLCPFRFDFSVTFELLRRESLLSALSGQEGAHLAHHPLPLHPQESKSGHFSAQWSICQSTTPSSDSLSSPAFWRILPRFGPVAPPPPGISWPAVRVTFPFPSGPLWAPETRFGRGWAHWVGCIRWSYCLEWAEERPLLDGRGRWPERAQF